MNYRNILGLGLIVFTAFSLQSAFASGGKKDYLDPIRTAKGRFQVIRVVMEFDTQKDMPVTKRDVVCTKNMDVYVYEVPKGDSWGIGGRNIECVDNYQGEEIHIGGDAYILYSNQSLFGEPPQDFKTFNVYTYNYYTNRGKELPNIPAQSSFTKDLKQSSFGLVSAPIQTVSCDVNRKCNISNPLSYQIVWEAEDRP